jgi:hypothetical protein
VFLVHDLLDQAVRDRHHAPIGRVDGVTLVLREGEPPLVSEVCIGGTVLARRLSPRLARWAAAIHRRLRGGEPTPTRLDAASLEHDGVEWCVDLDARDTPALAWELWLRSHVIARVPGGGK